MPYSSLDLAEGLTQQAKPPAAVPLNIPLTLPKPEPGKEQPETAYQRQRRIEAQERNRLLFEEQRQQAEAKELEILKREQAQRDYLRNKVNSVYENNPPPKPATERVWNKYTGTYQERPVGYSPSTDRASIPPSSATPPATPRNSGSGLGMNMQDSPATGQPRTATAPVEVMERPPTSLPVPAAEINAVQSLARNAATGGVITGVVDFGAQVMTGRPVVDAAGHAAFSGVGGTAGTIIGASAGSVLGPAGAYVGGMVGGMVGAGVGGFLYDQLFPRPAQLPVSIYEASPPFTGGQSYGVRYVIEFVVYPNGRGNGGEARTTAAWGPISKISTEIIERNGNRGGVLLVTCNGYEFPRPEGEFITYQAYGIPIQPGQGWDAPDIGRIYRIDGQPDTGGNPPPPPIQITNRTYTQINNQTTYTTPRAEPAAGQTPAPVAYAPSSITAKENGTARGDSPDWVPHGGLSGTPHPDTIPLPRALPSTEPVVSAQNAAQSSPLGGTAQTLADGTVVFTSPSTTKLDQPLPGLTNSGSLDPAPTSANKTTAQPLPYPSLTPQTAKPNPQPDATKPTPTVAPESPTQPTTDNVSKTDLDQFKKDLEKLLLGGTILAGLTPAIQTIGDKITQTAQQTTPQAITDASKQGCCDAFAPEGCNGDIRQNVEKAANNSAGNSSKLDQLNAALNSGDALLDADTNARVRNIEDKTGSNEYPMILPEYMMEDSLDKQVVIANQAQFNAWLLKNISALFGMFPIKIDKIDENGTKQTLKFDNLAETLAEFVGWYSKIAFDADTAVNVGIRAVAESIGARTAALQAGSYLKAIIDYLGFQTQPEPFPIKISCTIGATGVDGNLQESELDDFLKPSTQTVIGLDCKEQDDLHTIIKRILFDAEIARAALYKPLKPDKINNSLSITGDGIKEHRKKEQKQTDKKWEEFKTKIEGQTNLPFKIDIDEKGTNTTT